MNPGDKDTFERDLQQAETAYRQSGLDEPPDLLNQAILNRAKRAVDKPAARPWSFGWIHATATAALVVLGLTLVYHQREEAGNISGALDQLKPAVPASSEAASIGPKPQETAQFGDKADREIFTTVEDRRAAVAEAASEAENDQPDAGLLSRQIVSELREADPAAPELHKVKRSEESPIPVIATSRTNNSAPEQITLSRREEALSADVSPAPPAENGDNLDNAIEGQGQLGGNESDEQIPAGNDDVRADKLEMERNAPQSVLASKAAANVVGQEIQEPVEQKDQDSAKRAADRPLETRIDPETWLQDIRKLKEADLDGKWRLELQAFQDIYPNYPVPEDLREAMAKPEPE